MTDTTNHAMQHVPSMRERFWQALGFRYHLGGEPKGSEALDGWMRTDMRVHFTVLDRLRLLMTGRLFIALIVSTDTPPPSICKTRMDWRIVEPGGKW
jgi:hypothetical protein